MELDAETSLFRNGVDQPRGCAAAVAALRRVRGVLCCDGIDCPFVEGHSRRKAADHYACAAAS
eukprot:3579742-Pleurochrysis_carterae.AAC.4